MSYINSFFISIFYKKVGIDQFCNKYYESKEQDYLGRTKRYVIYHNIVEPSAIPPLWHAWLHYMINEVPNNIQNFTWQKNYVPNLTGTTLSHNLIQNNVREVRYSKWQPFNQ